MSTIAPAPPARKPQTPPPSLEAPGPEGSHLDGLGTPIEVKGVDRFATATITLLPFLLLGVAVWQTWNRECTGATF